MITSNREKIEDQILDENLDNFNFHNKLFLRVGAKGKTFTKVNFSHSYFEHGYFRDVVFDSCDFSGCKFINCNFTGSSFNGSKFDYAIFDKTIIDGDILDKNCPSHDNLTLKFARSLRINFQSLGYAEFANKAIKIELDSTKAHLFDSWASKKAYYRKKYQGWTRVNKFFEWFYFKLQEFVWGNGESWKKLVRTGFFIWIIMSLVDTFIFRDFSFVINYWHSFQRIPAIFFGVSKPTEYSEGYLTFMVILRLLGFALFTSLIIKRFNRR